RRWGSPQWAIRGLRRGSPWRLFSRAADDAALRRIRKVLCVAEKNDAARGIADLLSNSRMRRELKPSVPSQKAPLPQRQQVSGVH
uniref:Uncharacterized protein n=1 Tax=Anas zonorhyncha TaxID=75864 RepID=A0A8B9VSU1_9AVES